MACIKESFANILELQNIKLCVPYENLRFYTKTCLFIQQCDKIIIIIPSTQNLYFMATFREHYLPADTRLVGLAHLLNKLELNAPLNEFKVVSKRVIKNNVQNNGVWTIFSKSYWPGNELFHHLVFALKYETFNSLALKMILGKISSVDLEPFINEEPTGQYARKIWFLYEWFTHKKLNLEDLKSLSYIKILDEEKYFTLGGEKSLRHKVINNLIATEGFCFTILKTWKIQNLIEENIQEKTLTIIRSTDKRLISRAASFLLLSDTKATYEIEGERAPQNRLERWAKVITEAGKNQLSLEELDRLHRILITDERFVKIGLRDTEVFLGDRAYDQRPRPEFIGAKKDDLRSLMNSWLHLNRVLKESNLDPILQTAIIAFSFIYIHPLHDGNGRLHRYLLHHILADRDFTPKGIIFPVSSVIFDRIEEYRDSLTAISKPLMELIEWDCDEKLNVKILNETKILYQYYDFTRVVEFLYDVVKTTIEVNLPKELQELKMYDRAHESVSTYIEMPEGTLSLLINVIRGNNFKLSVTKRKRYFEELTDKEIADIELMIREAYSEL